MFGLDTNEKELKELLAQMGCEASVFKNFKNKYEKIEKRYDSIVSGYQNAKESGERLKELLLNVETYFTEHKKVDLVDAAKVLKKLKGAYIHVFLVSNQNREFESTYETSQAKLPGLEKHMEDHILMQSEVENLLAMITEDLEHQEPNLKAYAYFLLDHKDSELEELSPSKRCELVDDIYQSEVVTPVRAAVKQQEGKSGDALLLEKRFDAVFTQMI